MVIYVTKLLKSELDRLDLYHHICTLLIDGELYLAPIGEAPQRILDIGTGTGIWPIEMGDVFPLAEVRAFSRLVDGLRRWKERTVLNAQEQIIGNDLSPVQPKL